MGPTDMMNQVVALLSLFIVPAQGGSHEVEQSIMTYDAAGCTTLDMTYTGMNLHGGGYVQVTAVSATKGAQGTMYFKLDKTDPAIYSATIGKDASCSTTATPAAAA